MREGIKNIFNHFKANFAQGGMPMNSFISVKSEYLPQYTNEEVTNELEKMATEQIITLDDKFIYLTEKGRKGFMGW